MFINIKQWMDSMHLKMNPEKTEFIIFGSRYYMQKLNIKSIELLGESITCAQIVKCLGVLFDSNLTFKQHINAKVKTAMYNIKRIRSVRDVINREACEILVNGLVLSHLDYCNSVLVGLPLSTIHSLQRVQNIAAKLILGKRKYDSSTQCLKELHWLPIVLRIKFKIVCTVHKCIYGNAPLYLKDLLVRNVPIRTTRQSVDPAPRLIVPYAKRKTFAERSFSIQGPRLWNEIPSDLRLINKYDVFKAKLKTHYFQMY